MPQEVWICSEFLKHLSIQELNSGKGEVLKYAILDRDIHKLVMAHKESWDDVISKCISYKLNLVEKDPFDRGERAFLNLGHTLGHAFESYLKLPHGVGVAMGMKYLFKAMDLERLAQEVESLTHKLGMKIEQIDLDHYPYFKMSEFWNYVNHDKKRVGVDIQLILVKDVGEPYTATVSMNELRKRLENLFEGQS